MVFDKTVINCKIFAENCAFVSFWILLQLYGVKFYPGGGETFKFRQLLADFHEYTLNITYHGTDSYSWNRNLKFIHMPIHMPNLVVKLKVEVGFL